MHLPTNCILLGDCTDLMPMMPSNSIPLTVTSCPWDQIRLYGGHRWDFAKFQQIAVELLRITMPGRTVCWDIRDQILDGSHSGTTCRQFLFFRDIGFVVHDVIVVESFGQRVPAHRRYGWPPHVVLVLSKGKPRYVTLLRDRANTHAGKMRHSYNERLKDGTLRRHDKRTIAPALSIRRSIWQYAVGSHNCTFPRAKIHPATMPEKLARDLIWSYSRRGEVIFDPMAGAGTTNAMAIKHGRRHLGIEVNRSYWEVAIERVRYEEAAFQSRLNTLLK
jgi:DNA modification methylase